MENREIKFKGQRIENLKWIFGDLHYKGIMSYIRVHYSMDIEPFDDFDDFEVDPKTVGQFTGLTDKNRKEIYEGDIVRILYTDWPSKLEQDSRTLDEYLKSISHMGIVVWDENSLGYAAKVYSEKYKDYSYNSIHCGRYGFIEVIGNVHENPELLNI